MNKRRTVKEETEEYNHLNKIFKKKIRDDLRKYNKKLIRAIIGNNKNTKFFKTMNKMIRPTNKKILTVGFKELPEI